MEAMDDPSTVTTSITTRPVDNDKQLDQLDIENKRLREEVDKLVRQNAKLLILLRDREAKLSEAEIVIRRYRSRLVRWFEDMQYDPLDQDLPDKLEE
eukprot:gnl/Chilomastix_caulleri/613.p1 GENE.gnl/Chilomastix_caulleri/613~~gnl/Chilomastix_caulleri/613.p1  ORF type:complete len:97 (+),score=15.42 gnl/Chilomastix_caulleri/613:73-363(+)